MVNLTINNIKVSVPEGTTILEAAKKVNVTIPTLCYLKDINEIGACRICVVEVEGIERCVPACNTIAQDAMVIHTNSQKARQTRAANVRLILSQHDFHCATCNRNGNCSLQKIAQDTNIHTMPYKIQLEKNYNDPNFPLVRNTEKCIKCMRCVQICEKIQALNVWDVANTGSHTTVAISSGKTLAVDCSLCGQCITHCPVSALQERDDVEKVISAVQNDDLITVVQIAPAIRAAWGEAFGLTKEFATVKRLVSALRKVGFNYIFDTVFSADLTIMEEGSEFLQRLPEIKKSGLPMFTSCCPGWLRFIKRNYPDLVPQLSSAKSPQQMFGAITKSYYAKLLGVEPEKIYCVSIMPCTAKKNECTWDGGKDVDAVLTTREVDRMLKTYFIDPHSLEEEEFDSPLGVGTGAGVIFGATGGVMEAALRSAYYLVTGKNPEADAFKNVRGLQGWKEASYTINDIPIKVAVASGLGNVRKLVDSIVAGQSHYDFVEIMACPGGCVNGGGQPITDGLPYDNDRSQVLYGLDKINDIRFSHENPEILKCYKDFLESPLSEKSHHLLHIDHNSWNLE